jgi:hypothetical protein
MFGYGRGVVSTGVGGAWLTNRARNCPFIGGVTKRDSDSDTNDDYVDEYKTGVFASPSGSVRSFLHRAVERPDKAGTVGKGSCTMFLG